MTFLFDRNFGHAVPKVLEILGLPIKWHDQLFRQDTSDASLLREAGENDWILVTQDKRIRFNEHEIQALVYWKVRCVVLNTAQLTSWDAVRVLARAWDRLEAMVRSGKPPYIYFIDRRGSVSQRYP